MHRRSALKALATASLLQPAAVGAVADRPWLGPEYWANPLQDWRRRGERLECHVSGGDRNVYWLTRELAGDFTLSVRLGRLDEKVKGDGYAALRIGVKSWFGNYKDAAVRGTGLDAGVTNDGRLFIGELAADAPRVETSGVTLTLRLEGQRLTLEAGGQSVTAAAPSEWLTGGVALVCSTGIPSLPAPIAEPRFATAPKPNTARGGDTRYWFEGWTLNGAQVIEHPERAWGPILFNQYTLSKGVLKMTVQLAPAEPAGAVALYAGARKLAEAVPDAESHTAHFRIPGWNEKADVPYTVVYQAQRFAGTIRRNPTRDKIVVASLTCQNDFGYPHAEVARNVEVSRPDLLLFTGDQIYERNGEYGIQRGPIEVARLDYLRKWFLFGWAWGHLTRDIPTVCLCDDHDVYHGNIWGAGGRHAEYPGGNRADQAGGQDSGGYTMPAGWVNLVQRTQSSHLPDAYDPTPVDQNLTVYYTSLEWGGISFALLEDRKFKSAPKSLLPEARIRNGWIQNPAFSSATDGDVPGANLLGDRQEKFLEAWARDWSGGTWLKCAVSATIFCNLATLPRSAMDDSVTSTLPVQPLGTYAPDEKLVQDHDSNAWPQTPRNRAITLLRSCQALHLAGDQHLGSTVQYGIERHNDGVYALCAPAISNLFPRRWFPPNGEPLGEHRDGFGNRMTVRAVANPFQFGITPAALHERACGFSIVEFERPTRRITLTNWPRWADLTQPNAKPYPGWPITIHQLDNGLATAGYVVKLKRKIQGVVEVTHSNGERAYTLRLAAPTSTLSVWKAGRYRIRAGAAVLEGVAEARGV